MSRYSSLDIAARIKGIAMDKRDREYGPLKLQKLLWAAYGFWLVRKDAPLFINEAPLVWPYGPVFKEVYVKNKELELTPNFDRLEGDVEDLLQQLYADRRFGLWTGMQLTTWSHADYKAWYNSGGNVKAWNREIKEEEIKREFGKYIEDKRID